jgi:excisionase family DNA binding protein
MGPNSMTERWYSVDEIATHLGIARETVYRWIDRKGLPAHRIGKFWKFKLTEVDKWARTTAATADPDSKIPDSEER